MICLFFVYNALKRQNTWSPGFSALDDLHVSETPSGKNVALDAKDRSKTSSDQKRLLIAVSLYPLSFFVDTPFKRYKRISYIS